MKRQERVRENNSAPFTASGPSFPRLRLSARHLHVPGEVQQGEGTDYQIARIGLPPAQAVAGRGREGVVGVVPPSPIARTPKRKLLRLWSPVRYGRKPHRWQTEFTLQVTWWTRKIRTSPPHTSPVHTPIQDSEITPPKTAGSTRPKGHPHGEQRAHHAQHRSDSGP